ncbi:TetR/AcrR family transcriptional regulator [Pseudonocardia xinjiangensis]|uniref:TetR family transcriptional regulator n=1 Tax=Pseudonocardia xinjiangensis TaxID=75289 RepID=A0ABX1RJI3_9PSEU|nr:TetR/AcrR family transcriptional regulator [Pseudonocardia xinjiangensis]NMH79331.1 TetR family transcriptional regulator [Pseudonocardia xinjiangensis]
MSDRRTEILDAALHVLAEQGMRGLTHRAVDAAAGIPPGSTSYYFRSRSALVAGCVERLLEIDVQVDLPVVRSGATDVTSLAAVLASVCVAMVTEERYRTLARFELTLAAVRDEHLRAELLRGGDTIRRLTADLVRPLGATDPDRSADELAATLDGLILTALVRGTQDESALASWLRTALERALRAQPGVGLGRSSPDG